MEAAGVFQRWPKATLILGHMGETRPLNLWRFDCRWPISHRSSSAPANIPETDSINPASEDAKRILRIDHPIG
jgi:predicted TIM-barrel fold metal-dependent hydrolase